VLYTKEERKRRNNVRTGSVVYTEPVFLKGKMMKRIWKICLWIAPLLLFATLTVLTFFRPIGGDEIWNYNFARNIAKGLKPYKDISMVQTPLAAYLAALYIKLFGDSLFAFRLLGAMLAVVVFGLTYYVAALVQGNRWIPFIVCSLLAFFNMLVWLYNYNNLNLLLIVVLMYLQYRKIKLGESRTLLYVTEGVIFGLTPLVKQNTGVFIFGVGVLFCIYEYISKRNRKNAIIQFAASICPGILYVMYLLVSGTWSAFLDYAVLGIREFVHRTTLLDCMTESGFGLVLSLSLFAAIGLTVYHIIQEQEKERRELLLRLLLIALAASTIVYPLWDPYHVLCALVPYAICGMGIKKQQQSNLMIIVCIAEVIFGCVVMELCILESLMGEFDKFSQISIYKGIPIEERTEQSVIMIDEYILEKEAEGIEVLIAYEGAALYTVPLGIYHKDYDMLLVGNVGTQDVEKLLAQDKDTIFLLPKNLKSLQKQAHFELIYFICDNYSKVDEIGAFDVYAKK